MSQQARPVVVGVDGSEANVPALLYAAAEAGRLRTVLRLVHVVPDRVAVSPLMPLMPVDLADAGRAILAAAELRVAAVAPDVAVESSLRHGSRAAMLTLSAEDAEVLVIGRDDRPLIERLLRGDTATAVTGHASVPVVGVPAEWRPDRPVTGTVVVAVKSPRFADALLAEAFAEAQARGAELVVLHAWSLPSEYDDLPVADPAAAAWVREATRELESLVEPWRRTYPDVVVQTRVVHDHPAHAVVEAALDADLVVMVRRVAPPAVHLGSVAREVLRSADCPVRVVPPSETGPMPDLVLEEAGGLLA